MIVTLKFKTYNHQQSQKLTHPKRQKNKIVHISIQKMFKKKFTHTWKVTYIFLSTPTQISTATPPLTPDLSFREVTPSLAPEEKKTYQHLLATI